MNSIPRPVPGAPDVPDAPDAPGAPDVPDAPDAPGGESQAAMPILSHLEELRKTLVRCAIVGVILVGAAWAFSDRLLDGLIVLLIGDQKALALTPGEAFSARMELALWTGGVVGVPYLLLEAWRFVAPGLKKEERRFAIPWMLSSGILLYTGITFAFQLLLPAMIAVLQSFSTAHIESRVSVSSLLHFSVKLAAGCGLLFQMPLVLCLLAWFGIVSPAALWRQWRHAIFFIALGSAVITPGDGPSMLILMVPLVALYFISVIVALALWRARGRPLRERGTLA